MTVAIVCSTAIVVGVTTLNLYRLAMDLAASKGSAPVYNRSSYRNSSVNISVNSFICYTPGAPPPKKNFVELQAEWSWTIETLADELKKEEVIPYVLVYNKMEFWRTPKVGRVDKRAPPPHTPLSQVFTHLHQQWELPEFVLKKSLRIICEHEDMRMVTVKLSFN